MSYGLKLTQDAIIDVDTVSHFGPSSVAYVFDGFEGTEGRKVAERYKMEANFGRVGGAAAKKATVLCKVEEGEEPMCKDDEEVRGQDVNEHRTKRTEVMG
jgi:hypothetical protein